MGWLDRFANLDSASGSEVPAFFSLTPPFSPVGDTPHSAQLSRFNSFRMLDNASHTAFNGHQL